jgi:uncharacterized protein
MIDLSSLVRGRRQAGRPPQGGGRAAALLLAAGWWSGAAAAPAPTERLEPAAIQPQPVPLQNVTLRDSFWAPKFEIYRTRTIPHSWFNMQWNLRALQKANGQAVQGDLNGTWDEANLHKFLETVAYSLAIHPDAELERRMEEVIALLRGAQQPDGYLHVHVTNTKKPPWDPAFLDGSHDGYVLGHMIEAALEYHAATGKTNFLAIARRAADQACRHFLGPPEQAGFCGHAELEMALVELYRVTGQARYLELARAFVEWRGRSKVKPVGETPRAYFQDGAPLREQRTLEGHAVRALFFATGVADLALATGSWDYRLAANRFWDSTTLRRMTITGSVGPRQEHEAFGEDYELPNDGYYESCAACGLADFAQRMFWLEKRAESADVLERVLYNAVLHGMELTGTNSYYQNPLSDRDRVRYNSWVCCPPNLSRTLLQVGRYAYAYDDHNFWFNLYVGGRVRAPLAGTEAAFDVATDYPWSGTVKATAALEKPARFALYLRRPGWCQGFTARINGRDIPVTNAMDHGYLRVERNWQAGDSVELAFDMPVQRMVAHPNIESCRGKVALQRGPIVYGFEGLDHGGDPKVTLGTDPRFQVEHRPNFLGGVTVIKGVTAENKPFLAIPFYALANRGKSSQEIWVSQRGLKRDEAWWLGALYRPARLPSP